jgi:hypothetical protein
MDGSGRISPVPRKEKCMVRMTAVILVFLWLPAFTGSYRMGWV